MPRVYAAMGQGMLHMHFLQAVQIRLVAERLSLRQLHVIVPVFSSRVCISYVYIYIHHTLILSGHAVLLAQH